MQDEYLEREKLEKDAAEAKEAAERKDKELVEARKAVEVLQERAKKAAEMTLVRSKELRIRELETELFNLRQNYNERGREIRTLKGEKASLEKELQEARAREAAIQLAPAGFDPCDAFKLLMDLPLVELNNLI